MHTFKQELLLLSSHPANISHAPVTACRKTCQLIHVPLLSCAQVIKLSWVSQQPRVEESQQLFHYIM